MIVSAVRYKQQTNKSRMWNVFHFIRKIIWCWLFAIEYNFQSEIPRFFHFLVLIIIIIINIYVSYMVDEVRLVAAIQT